MGMGSDGFHGLLRLAQEGDRGAMDRVLAVLRPYLEQMARPYADPVRPVQSTTDLLQESCLRAWNRIGTFHGGDSDEETFAMFRSWIGQIVARIGLDQRKARDRKRRIPPARLVRQGALARGETGAGEGGVELDGGGDTPSRSLRSKETLDRVRAAIREIADERDALILQLYFYDGLSLRQISEHTGFTYDKVKERYWATLRGLQQGLDGCL